MPPTVDAPADGPGWSRWRWPGLSALAVLLAVYQSSAFIQAHALGFPLDDAWIHAQFARNLASGLGFTYTAGQWVSGSTAPAWTLLVAAGYFLIPNAVIAGMTIGIALAAASVLAASRLATAMTGDRRAGVIAAVVTALTPITAWGALSGMEVPLSNFLVLGGAASLIEAHERGRSPQRGLALLALSCLARPENLVLFGLAVLQTLVASQDWKALRRRLALAAVLAAVTLGPWAVLSYATTGRPLPTTFYAKSGPGVVRAMETGDAAMAKRAIVEFGESGVAGFGRTIVAQLSPAAALAVVGGAWGLARRRRAAQWWIAVALVVMPFAIGIVAPQRVKPDNVRYIAQLVSLTAVLAASGFWLLVRRLPAPAIITAVVVAAVGLVINGAGRPAEFGLQVRNINDLHVAAGRWVRTHVPGGAVIAANDVGALAYFGGHRVIDLEGLVSPEVLRYRDGQPNRGLRIVTDTRPDYLVISPSWYPDIVTRATDFPEQHRMTIPDNIAAGDASLVVLATPWTRHPLIGILQKGPNGSE